MKFVIIDKTYKDFDRTRGPYSEILPLFPDNYPLTCIEKEYESMGKAVSDNIGKQVMTVEQYDQHQRNLINQHKNLHDLMRLKTKEINLLNGMG